jgi:hypothetical protein
MEQYTSHAIFQEHPHAHYILQPMGPGGHVGGVPQNLGHALQHHVPNGLAGHPHQMQVPHPHQHQLQQHHMGVTVPVVQQQQQQQQQHSAAAVLPQPTPAPLMLPTGGPLPGSGPMSPGDASSKVHG